MHYPCEATQEIQAGLYWGSCCSRVPSLAREDPLQKRTAAHSRILACKIPWTESLVAYSPWGHKRLGHNWACKHACCNRGSEDRHLVPLLALHPPRGMLVPYLVKGLGGQAWGRTWVVCSPSWWDVYRDVLRACFCSWFFRSGQGLPRWH